MASPRRHAPSHRPTPSIPLPLPTRFGALPSRLPGKTLTPVLYTLINTAPVYLTLSPSSPPHFSLLPLLLSLEPPIAPLQVLTSCKLGKGDYSLDLNGEAPFIDLWVPFERARAVCDYLGVSRLFWDVHDGRKGLLGSEVARAVSWDESHALGHNWLPSPSSLPPSSYSLGALLDTPFGSIAIIPEERCITTPIDRNRRAHIISQALGEDKSTIRPDTWGAAREALLKWTVQAWEVYLEHPSHPESLSSTTSDDPRHVLLRLVPGLLSSNLPSYTPSQADIQRSTAPTWTPHSHWHILTTTLWHLNPFYRPVSPAAQILELQARINLGLIESIGMSMVAMWRARNLIEYAHSADLVPRIVIDCSHGDCEAVNGFVPPAESSVDDFEELQDRRKSSPPRMRRKIRRKSRSFPRVTQHSARSSLRVMEKVDDWIDQAANRSEPLNPPIQLHQQGSSDLPVRGNGTGGHALDVGTQSKPPWKEPEENLMAVFDAEDDESIADSNEVGQITVSHATEKQIGAEVIKTARLPWWIIGTTITLPILSFMLVRSNWGIFMTIWTASRSAVEAIITIVTFVTRHLSDVSIRARSLTVAAWHQRDSVRERLGTASTLARDTWRMAWEGLCRLWVLLSSLYTWAALATGLRKS